VSGCIDIRQGWAVLALALSFLTGACTTYRWTERPVSHLRAAHDSLAGRVVRIERDSGAVTLQVANVEESYALGRVLDASGPLEVDPAVATRLWRYDERPRGRLRPVYDMSQQQLRAELTGPTGPMVRFAFDRDSLLLRNTRPVGGGWVRGHVVGNARGPARIALADVKSLSERRYDRSATIGKRVAVIGVTLGVIGGLVSYALTHMEFTYTSFR
jgi:hypothetical protein